MKNLMNTETVIRFPFPFSKGAGICSILCGPQIWASSIKKLEIRHIIKRISKKDSPRRILDVTDNNNFGLACIELLASTKGRCKLATEYPRKSKRSSENIDKSKDISLLGFIGLSLFEYICEPYKQIKSSDDDGHTYENLNANWLNDWLAKQEIGKVDQKSIVLLGCAIAIIQPGDALDIANILSKHVDDLTAYLSEVADFKSDKNDLNPHKKEVQTRANNNEKKGDKSNKLTNLTKATEKNDPIELATQRNSHIKSDIYADLLLMLSAPSNWQQSLSLSRWRQAINLINNRTYEEKQALDQLEELVTNVDRDAKAAKYLPWWREPLDLKEEICLKEDSTANLERIRLSNLQHDLTRLMQAHGRYEALLARANHAPEAWLTGARTPISDLATEIETRSLLLDDYLEQLGKLIIKANSLLDEVIAGDAMSAVHLVAEIRSDEILALAKFIFDPAFDNEATRERRAALCDLELGGLLLAHLFAQDDRMAFDFVRILIPPFGEHHTDIISSSIVLSWLNYNQIQQISLDYPEIAPTIALLIFASAIKQERPELLDYIEPLLQDSLLDTPSYDFFRTLALCRQRGDISSLGLELLSASTLIDNARTAEHFAEQLRLKVIEFIDLPPGMNKMFHRLRLCAQQLFLEPLRPKIEEKDPRSVEKIWIDFGDLETMVDVCVSHLKKVDHIEPRHYIEQRHYEQTRNYLEEFQERLIRWIRIATDVKSSSVPELIHAIDNLRNQAALSPMVAALAHILEDEESINLIPDDFGERLSKSLKVKVLSEMSTPFLRPTMLTSWPKAIDGTIPISNLLADFLREKLIKGITQLSQAVDFYIANGQFEAARRAAKEDPELLKRVKETQACYRDQIKSQNANLLTEAESVKELDANISEYLNEVESALDEGEFGDAIAAIDLLRECIAEFRNQNQPARTALITDLQEAGVDIPDRSSLDDLEALLQKVRNDNYKQRQHIIALDSAISQKLASEPVKILWPDATRRFDRREFWPDSDTSGLLSEAVNIIEKKLRGKWNSRLGDNDPSTTIVQNVANWTIDQLAIGLEAHEKTSVDHVIELAQLLDDGYGDAALQRFIGETIEYTTSQQTSTNVETKIVTGALNKLPKAKQDSIPTMFSLLTGMVDNEPHSEASDFNSLRNAARSNDWVRTRSLVIGMLKINKPSEENRHLDLLAIYAVSLFYTENQIGEDSPNWLKEACIAVAASRQLSGYLGEKIVREFIPAVVFRCIPIGVSKGSGESTNERFGRVIEATAKAPANTPEFLWMTDLFRRSGDIAPKLADFIWERFTGLSRNEHYRSALLQLLSRCRQQEALRALTKEVPERAKRLVRTTLDAFITAELQPEARSAALQLSAALRDQASGVANTKPWILFFHNLQTVQDVSETNSLDLELDSEVVFEEPNGVFSIELRIRPSLFAPPEQLILTVGSGVAKMLCEEAIFNEHVFQIQLPNNIQFSSEGECSLPWRLEGQTTMGQRIALGGKWTLHRERPTSRISKEFIDIYWPGAKLEPVKPDHGFHGRKNEIRLIESYLCAMPRPRSVMVFGERRIGKTSLLKAVILGLPPSRDRICGAFCDASGIEPPGPGKPLSVLFFRKILAALENRDDNEPIIKALESHKGHPVSIARLAKDLDPETSLFTALTTFVYRLEEASGGVIKRLALCIDEFDRFAAPLLLNERAQVDTFLWQLREVVQRSERIAFVLAGSGIQRLLKENYQDALYGSIAEVHLPRFQWVKESEAIFDTFLPLGLRDRLCRPNEAQHIAKHAAHLCGGHPMFLALLGRTAAALANGRYLTTGLLDRIVERIVKTDDMFLSSGFDRKVFYECVFQTLDVLPDQEFALAKGLFVTLAELTTPSDPKFASFQVSRLFEVSGLLQFADTRQLLQALDRLTKAEVIVNENARVRISVPISAASVREDAMLLRDDITNTLQTLCKKQ